MRRLVLITVSALAVAASVSLGAGYSRQYASYTLSSHKPSHSTAERFRFDYVNPDDPNGKPPAVSKVITILPHGARYDASAPGSCGASDAELMAEGGAACPPDSAVGGGVTTVDTGVPGPDRFVTADVEFFNNENDPNGEFVYVNTVRGTSARTVIRADVTKRRTITTVGMLPGTPPDGGAIDTADLKVKATSTAEGSHYITTPPRCPASGHWTTRLIFEYAGGARQTAKTPTPCK